MTVRWTFWPTLSSLVKLSPQPKIFSPGDSVKTGLMDRELSDPRFRKLNGSSLTCEESLSAI